MTNRARDQHRQLDQAYAEAEAREGRTITDNVNSDPADIVRPRQWRRDNVSANRQRESRVLVLKLRQRTSERGTVYLDGWMGQAKLIGFKDAEPDEYGNEVWSVYAVTPQPREGLASGARQRVYGREAGQ
jgi:hypothetical protein